MANYLTIEDLVSSVSNATKIRDNSPNYSEIDIIQGVDWFIYEGLPVDYIDVSGNSWIGFYSLTQGILSMNNTSDAVLLSIWREEGYVYNNKFLRIRWEGYVVNSNYLLTYDVIFLDNGMIIIYLVDQPSSYYNGNFSLDNIIYNKPTTSNRYVTFIPKDNTYLVEYNCPDFLEQRFLIRNENILYTIEDNTLVQLNEDLTSTLFLERGMVEVPSSDILLSLSSPQVLLWHNVLTTEPKITAILNATPKGKFNIISNLIDIENSSILGMEDVEINSSDNIEIFISFNEGEWKTFNGEEWTISETGMSPQQFKNISMDTWNNIINLYQSLKIKVILENDEYINNIKFNFVN